MEIKFKGFTMITLPAIENSTSFQEPEYVELARQNHKTMSYADMREVVKDLLTFESGYNDSRRYQDIIDYLYYMANHLEVDDTTEARVFIELKIWPDGSWLYTDENWSHKSDDYIVATVESIDGEPDEKQIHTIANGGTL